MTEEKNKFFLEIKIPDSFKEIELTEAQAEAFLEFLKDFSEKQKAFLEQKINTEKEKEINSLRAKLKKQIKQNKILAEKLSETRTLVNTIKEKYAENFSEALQELTESVFSTLKKEFLNSEEYKILQKIKEDIAPLFLKDKEFFNEEIISKYKELEKISLEKERLKQKEFEINKKEIIEILLEDIEINEKQKKTIKNFLIKSKNIDEIYDNFVTVLQLINEKMDESLNKENIKEKKLEKINKLKNSQKEKREIFEIINSDLSKEKKNNKITVVTEEPLKEEEINKEQNKSKKMNIDEIIFKKAGFF